ncbi:MAG: DUF3450 domain-containing protein [Porticoccaceae bacterium]|nr:DUF3450 domain-containing protein [Porticoccaceae bacterium]
MKKTVKKQNLIACRLLMVVALGLAIPGLTPGLVPGLQATELDIVIKAGADKTAAAQASQRRIDDTAQQSDSLLRQFQLVNKQIEGLQVYNAQLSRQIDNQRRTVSEIEQSIENAALIERQITPLSLSMLDALEQFIHLDLPFKLAQRQSSIDQVRKNMDSASFSAAEKSRQVLELYDIESEYSATIEQFDGLLGTDELLGIDGQQRQGAFLRIGRLALLFQSGDQGLTKVWDKNTRQWQGVSAGEYRRSVADAIRMAKKQAPLDMMKLPIAAPESASAAGPNNSAAKINTSGATAVEAAS